MPSLLRPCSALVVLLPGVALAAEPPVTRTPATAEACMAISVDAERLACYDVALGRSVATPEQADAAANRAREAREAIARYDEIERESLPPAERVQRRLGELFANESRLPRLQERIADAGRGSLLDSRWELAKSSKLGLFSFRAYKPVYLLPLSWTDHPNRSPRSSDPEQGPVQRQDLSDVEARFQLSFKAKAAENLFGDNGDVWIGYTQSSRWQVFNREASRPFRETNYEPEAMLVFRTGYRVGPWHGRLLGIGLNHQSNGREDPFSRSWNRVMLHVGWDREDWALMLRPWWRIPDSEDENPGMQDYVGRGDATLVHRRGGHQFALMARHSLRTGGASHGALQFDWGFPLNNTLRGHVQLFDGYGESLIDYDHRAVWIGLGVSLMEWY